MKNPEFRMYVGPMFGGKTTRMLGAAERYHYQQKNVLYFKPDIDGRYEKETPSIVTHNQHKVEAIKIKTGLDIIKHCLTTTNDSIIAVDEAFMIDGSGDALIRLFRQGYTILVSSLQLSSDGSAYREIEKMMPYATHIAVCPAVDIESGHDAYYTEKFGGRTDHGIEVGGAEMYRPRDWHGFFGK